jgi:hypothetical protein
LIIAPVFMIAAKLILVLKLLFPADYSDEKQRRFKIIKNHRKISAVSAYQISGNQRENIFCLSGEGLFKEILD